MLDSLLVNCLVEEQLNEEDVEAAVENWSERIEQVEPGVLTVGTWKDWDRAWECSKDIVEEEAKPKEADVEGVAVWAVVPWELHDFEESEANSGHSSKVQNAVLDLKVWTVIYSVCQQI